MPRIILVAGDPSGDQHAARLVAALTTNVPGVECVGLGGPAMRQAGVVLLDDLTTAATIGPFDAAKHLGRFVRARRRLRAELEQRPPDVVILVDFGDFNLPVIAPLVKRYRIPIAYYISPQLWAWGRWRLRYVRRYVDRMIVLFPFEEQFYRQAGVPVTWVGHPLMDRTTAGLTRDQAFERFGLNRWRRTVGLLPGSRTNEVARHAPTMLRAAKRIAWQMPGVQFLLLKSPHVPRTQLERLRTHARCDVVIAEGALDDALPALDAAIVASGTATLETALRAVPMVVVYQTSWPTYLAARCVVRVPHIAMVNILAGRRLVPEFVQQGARPSRIAATVIGLLRDDEQANAMRQGLREVTQQLGLPGATNRAADAVQQLLALGDREKSAGRRP